MKNTKTLKRSIIITGLFVGLSGLAHADSVSDLMALVAKTRAVIGNSVSIDSANSETTSFSTNIDGQLVELNLLSSRLNDSFLSAINYDSFAFKKMASRKTAVYTDVTFEKLNIILDGCNITSALYAQCTTNSCWDASLPTPTEPTSMTGLAGKFGTKINLNLSTLNPSSIMGCSPAPGQMSFFDASHTSHTLEFVENGTKGGTLSYQVIIYQKPAL